MPLDDDARAMLRALFAELHATDEALELALSERQKVLARIYQAFGDRSLLYKGVIYRITKTGKTFSVQQERSKARSIQ